MTFQSRVKTLCISTLCLCLKRENHQRINDLFTWCLHPKWWWWNLPACSGKVLVATEFGWGAITHTCAILKVCGEVSYFLVFLVWSRSFWGSTTALLDPKCRSQLLWPLTRSKHTIKPPLLFWGGEGGACCHWLMLSSRGGPIGIDEKSVMMVWEQVWGLWSRSPPGTRCSSHFPCPAVTWPSSCQSVRERRTFSWPMRTQTPVQPLHCCTASVTDTGPASAQPELLQYHTSTLVSVVHTHWLLVSVVDTYWSVWGRNLMSDNLLQCSGLLCITDYRSFCSRSFLARCQNTPFFSAYLLNRPRLYWLMYVYLWGVGVSRREQSSSTALLLLLAKSKYIHFLWCWFFLGLWSHLV